MKRGVGRVESVTVVVDESGNLVLMPSVKNVYTEEVYWG